MDKETLLIGGTGFVGQALAPCLVRAGHKVHLVARRPVPVDFDGKAVLHASPLDNAKLLHTLLPECQTVFYLASDSTPGTSASEPVWEAELNLTPALRFLDILQKYDHVHLIFISSGGTVYGNPRTLPVDEDHPLSPLSYHGAGKIATEAFLQAYCRQYGRNVTILRPSNFYGPGQPYRKGFGIVRSILEHLRRDLPVEIWGDGENVRDFIYIEDFVDACIRLSDRGRQNSAINIFNVGYGKGVSINQLCGLVESATGRRIRTEYRAGRSIDVRSVVLDYSKLHQYAGWKPITDLETGLTRTWEWLKALPL
jgi:UDP-glucose 4-epimerase